MAAVGCQLFHCFSNYMANYNVPHGQGGGSGSESGPASGSYSIPTSDAQSDQPASSFDFSEYIDILMEPAGVVMPQAMMPGGTVSEPLVQRGMSTSQLLMENSVFQATQNNVEFNVPTSSGGTSAAAMERPRTERIAFRMQSDVEIVDDGYKWRKYGKKAVKNSPNPRNYYRCSTEGCSVKKRVEREKDNPSYVITTYEGVHNHVSPTMVYDARQDATSGRYYVAGMHMPPTSQGI